MKITPDVEIEQLLKEAKIAGKLDVLGEGTTRTVYRHPQDKNLVIKKSKRNNRSNWTEYLIYDAIHENSSLECLFAKVSCISESGKYLIMECLKNAGGKGIGACPNWYTDRKPDNFGEDSNGAVKILDYGSIKLDCLSNTAIVQPPSSGERQEMENYSNIIDKISNFSSL